MSKRAFAFAVLIGRAAPGQQHDSSTAIASAAALYKTGNEALKRGDDATACAKFEAGLKLYRSGSLLVRVADCEVRGGKLADASAHYGEAIEGLGNADPKDPQIAAAKARLRKIEKRIPRLVVRLATGAPRGTTVRCDGLELPAGSLGEALPVNVGEHTIVVAAPGRQDATFVVSTAEGQTGEIDVSPGESPEPPPSERRDTEGREPAGAQGSSVPGYVLGSIGIVAFGVAGFSFARIKHYQGAVPTSCNNTEHACGLRGDVGTANGAAADARAWTAPFWIGLAVGAVGVGGGAYFLLTNSANSNVTVSVGPAGVSIRGRL